jgi:hypothetical protein
MESRTQVTMCQFCHLYTAIGKPCDVCGLQAPPSAPVAVSKRAKVAAPTKAKKARKQAKSASKEIKPLLAATAVNRLHAAGLNTDAKIAAGIVNGIAANALYGTDSGDSEGVFLRYMLIVERIENEYPEVARFRNRMVSGLAV